MTKIYAGIGSRRTPQEMLELIKKIGGKLAELGWTLRTGACCGPDQYFANGALKVGGNVVLCLPWWCYEKVWVKAAKDLGAQVETLTDTDREAFEAVKEFHPAAHRLMPAVKKLHARNHNILKGSSFVVCYTPGGKVSGGTGQALREAISRGVLIRNLGNPEVVKRVKKRLKI